MDTTVNVMKEDRLTKKQLKTVKLFEKKLHELRKEFYDSQKKNSPEEKLQINIQVVYGFQKNKPDGTAFLVNGSNNVNGTEHFRQTSNKLIFAQVMPSEVKEAIGSEIEKVIKGEGKKLTRLEIS
jgi:hypothetical protein